MDSTANLTLRDGIDVFRRRWPDVQSRSADAPILLMAAGYRTGSTLLQRMLSSECLMWGEPYGHGGLLDSLPDVFRRIRDFWPEDSFFYEGQDAKARASTFIANLYPSPQVLLDSYVGFFENLFARPAKDAGIDRWGIKTVRCSADHAYFLRWLFPQSKLIFLVRNPYHAFRSYDAIRRERGVIWFNRWPDRPLDAREFGRHWRQLTASFYEKHDELGARLLCYEDLIGGRCDLEELENFLGVPVDQAALSANPGGWPRQQIEPDESQLEILREEVEPLAEQLGYAAAGPQSRKLLRLSEHPNREALDRTLQEAMVTHQAGDSATAEGMCRRILEEDAEHPGAWHFLGLLRLGERTYTAAGEFIARAIALCDTKPVYHNNYGAVLLELGQNAEAETAFRRSLELNADYADAWSNLGHVQHLRHAPPNEAEKSLRQALRLHPAHRDAMMHLADLCRDHGRIDDAIQLWEKWLGCYGDHPEPYKKLGQVLGHRGQYQEAKTAFERAISLAPDDANLHLALGSLEAGWERIGDAKRAFQEAASLRPERTICGKKYLGVCPSVFSDSESIDHYWANLDRELDAALDANLSMDWRLLAQDGFTPSFNLPHHNRSCREIKEKFARLFQEAFPQRQPEPRPGLDQGRRIRVGFLVTAGHEPGFLRGTARIIEELDAARFEPVVFCPERSVKRVGNFIKRERLPVVPIPNRFDRAVDVIRETRCDVMNYWKVGADNWDLFLPMARLAPLQCTSWGTHGTSGVDAVDYYISSSLMETANADVDIAGHYTEQLALLPTLPTYQRRQPLRKPASRSDFGLPAGGAIYLCPHRLPKYHPEFDSYLRDILEQDPAGHLVILCGMRSHAKSVLQHRLTRSLGNDLCRRVFYLPAMHVERYYQLLSLATVVLDSIAYAGGITAYDVFSFGVPIVTQPGPLAVQNYTDGLYRRMSVTELTARNRQEYVEIAARLGTQPDYRKALSQQLMEASEVIFDDPATTPAHEAFFMDAIQKLIEVHPAAASHDTLVTGSFYDGPS
ncbi:MAG: tetratricopeptide repeat protein [Candidatus Paceibacterota bacterium]